jgi:hypothetical protein
MERLASVELLASVEALTPVELLASTEGDAAIVALAFALTVSELDTVGPIDLDT